MILVIEGWLCCSVKPECQVTTKGMICLDAYADEGFPFSLFGQSSNVSYRNFHSDELEHWSRVGSNLYCPTHRAEAVAALDERLAKYPTEGVREGNAVKYSGLLTGVYASIADPIGEASHETD